MDRGREYIVESSVRHDVHPASVLASFFLSLLYVKDICPEIEIDIS